MRTAYVAFWERPIWTVNDNMRDGAEPFWMRGMAPMRTEGRSGQSFTRETIVRIPQSHGIYGPEIPPWPGATRHPITLNWMPRAGDWITETNALSIVRLPNK